ncbi:MAG: PAS domain-containing protein [Spirochaetes bacterium]|jgi:PAS domain S-box-containing protein|nr:PAS domain-containing protein [Spirochaetota bacterium]
MRGFIERALNKLDKLDSTQIRTLIHDLASEHEQMQVVLDSMNDAVVVSDNDHNLVMVNKAAERLLPLMPGDLAEHKMWEIIRDEEISAFVEEALEAEDSVWDVEFTLEHSGGERTLLLSLFPLVRSGHVTGNILRVEDATERKSREARLRRAESLASLTTLAAGVAHEIKNPLGSIGIHIQLIQKELAALADDEKERIQGYIDVVNEEVNRLNKIVVDFLFAVRPMNVELEDEDMNSVLGDLLEFVRYELDESDIELEADLQQDLPKVQLDDKYFKQALMNIVKNALAAMPNGGTLRVKTRCRGDSVELIVEDTGEGMSQDVREKIFEPYFTTRDFGSGIGLTLVYKVVKEHMGEISVRSEEGEGTRFILTFPVPQREQHLLEWSGEDSE